MYYSRTRTRNKPMGTIVLGEQTLYDQSVQTHNSLSWSPSLCTTDDEVHPDFKKKGLSPTKRFLVGGPFEKREIRVTHRDTPQVFAGYDYINPTWNNRQVSCYRGIYRVRDDLMYQPSSDLPLSQKAYCTNVLGPQAWSKYRPAKPLASLAVFIAELRDLPKMLVRRTWKELLSFRSLGNHYLEAQFGWFPFISDLHKVLSNLHRLDILVEQLARDNGRPVRRKGPLSHKYEMESAVTYTDWINSSGITPALYAVNGYQRDVETVLKSAWFSGRFRYYIPGLDRVALGGSRGKLKKWWAAYKGGQLLLDLKIGPRQVYELVPWSWLFDWSNTASTALSNYGAFVEDNVAADYAYVMLTQSTHVERTIKFQTQYQPWYGADWITQDHIATCRKAAVTKTRASANPFGFNWGWDGITPYQTGILAALGQSRCRY